MRCHLNLLYPQCLDPQLWLMMGMLNRANGSGQPLGGKGIFLVLSNQYIQKLSTMSSCIDTCNEYRAQTERICSERISHWGLCGSKELKAFFFFMLIWGPFGEVCSHGHEFE